ncbi:MAG: hypothetical protein NC930_08490 [Candidatus Omnitrophica bacterium]|nr:hypothetical protein [Candidatus Omnitrophota bacterium]
MKKLVTLVLVLSLVLVAVPAFAQAPQAQTQQEKNAYLDNMKNDFVRGFKNVVGAPLEIPITIQDYHKKEGRPVIRHIAGLIDGVFQGVVRFGSGAWDFIAAVIPDHQEGMPVDPETLF